MTKVLLFRVGIDTTNEDYNKFEGIKLPLSPLFEDSSFVFLPIKGDGDTIKNIEEKFKIDFSKYLGKEYIKSENIKCPCHYDPCFNFDDEYSYGDRTRKSNGTTVSKAHKLLELCKGDYLVFCSAMVRMKKEDYEKKPFCSEIIKIQQNWCKTNRVLLCIIGYFRVKEIIDGNNSDFDREYVCNHFKNNAHIMGGQLDNKSKKKFVFVNGCPKESQFFKKAKIIATSGHHCYKVKKEYIKYFGNTICNHCYKW